MRSRLIGGAGGHGLTQLSTLASFLDTTHSRLPTCGSRTFERAGYAAIDQICDYYQTLNERPVKSEVKPGYLLEQLPSES